MVEPIYNSFTQLYAQGHAIGRKLKQQKVTDNALAKYASGDTTGGVNELLTVDPDAAFGLQDRTRENDAFTRRQTIGAQAAGGDIAGGRKAALEAGDFDLVDSLGKLDQEQRTVAQQQAGTLAAVGIRLLDTPVEQRGPAILSLKDSLIARGFQPEQIDAVAADPSDANLNAIIGQAMTVKDAIDWQNQMRDDEETRRYHDIMADKPVVLSNGAVAIDRQDGGVIARNPKSYAPARASGKSGKQAPWAMDWSK